MTDILDLVTLSKEEIFGITGIISNNNVPLPKKDARKVVQFTWWYNELASQRVDRYLQDDSWMNLSNEDFDNFRRTKVPGLTSGVTVINPQKSSNVTDDMVSQIQKSIKLELNQYPEFKGGLEQWLPFNRKLKAIAAMHGVDRIIGDTNKNIEHGSQDSKLYELQNNFVYSMFTQKLARGAAILALRHYEDNKDARGLFHKLVDHYES